LVLTAIGQDREELQVEQGKPEKARKRNRKDTSEIITQPLRLEIELEDMNDEFVLIEGHEEDLLVVQNTGERLQNGKLWQFHFVNKDLKIEWDMAQVIGTNGELIGYDYSQGYYFLLFDNISRYRDYKAMVISVDGEKSVFQGFSLPFRMDLQYFEALDNGILLVGEYMGRPVAMIHDLVGGKPQVLPGFYNFNERVFDVVMDERRRTFSIVLSERMRNGKYTNRVKSFTYEGLLIQESTINPGENLNLVDGTTTSFGNGVQYMAGTYSRKNSLYSRGIYISKFTNGQQRFLKNYNYGDLNNFFAYRGERAAKRIARRVARKKRKGKEPKFSYRLYIHEIIQNRNFNVMIAEAYYARYSTTSRSFYGSSFYNPYYNTYGFNNRGQPIRNFLGYKYTHAIVVAFNSKGEIIWDNSFETNDITSYNLQESVAVNVQGDKAVVMYLDNNEIRSKVVDGNEAVEGKTYNPVRLLYPGDKLRSRDSDIKGVNNWYDNYLYSYGVQRIKNKNFPRKERKRKVFYINKIEFDEKAEDFSDYQITANQDSD